MQYKATHHQTSGKTLGFPYCHEYWDIRDENGELYARISEEALADDECTGEDFARVLAYALTHNLPVSQLGGMTIDQYEAARQHMEQAK